eukprot:1189937-Prorocentrum_minimum.AAC.3
MRVAFAARNSSLGYVRIASWSKLQQQRLLSNKGVKHKRGLSPGCDLRNNRRLVVTAAVTKSSGGSKGKGKTIYVCEDCGEDSPQWHGKCPSCGTWNTLKQFHIPAGDGASGTGGGGAGNRAAQQALSAPPRGSRRSSVGIAQASEAIGVSSRRNSWVQQSEGPAVPPTGSVWCHPHSDDGIDTNQESPGDCTAPRSLSQISRVRAEKPWRIPLEGELGREVSQVLGGGLVPGCLVLLGANPPSSHWLRTTLHGSL